MIVTIKDYPKLAQAIKQAMPGYKKHKAIIVQADKVTPTGGYWDGGSRDGYAAYTLYGAFVCHVPTPTAPPQFGGGEPKPFAIADHMIVIKSGVFRGKTATIFVYMPAPSAFGIDWKD